MRGEVQVISATFAASRTSPVRAIARRFEGRAARGLLRPGSAEGREPAMTTPRQSVASMETQLANCAGPPPAGTALMEDRPPAISCSPPTCAESLPSEFHVEVTSAGQSEESSAYANSPLRCSGANALQTLRDHEASVEPRSEGWLRSKPRSTSVGRWPRIEGDRPRSEARRVGDFFGRPNGLPINNQKHHGPRGSLPPPCIPHRGTVRLYKTEIKLKPHTG